MENRPAPLRSRRVCRFCLTESEPLSFIYERDHSKPFQVPLTLQIMSCVSIEVYAADGMPQMICNMCRWNLDRSYKFKLQCKKADEALRAYPLSGVLPRPFPPLPNEPPDVNNKRHAEQRVQNEGNKKPRVDNGDRDRRELRERDRERDRDRERERERDRQAEKREKEEHNFYKGEDAGSDEDQDTNSAKEDRKLEPGEIRVHACDQCDRTFPLRQALALHIQRAHRDRNYKCTECDRMFFSKYDLQKHMTTHSEEKPYSCAICNKQFSRQNLLQRHEKVHRDELRYGCQHCDREFFTTEELEKHEEAVHKKEKPFQCNICNKCFTYKQGLERHEMLHNEDKTFVCEYCKEAFRTSTKLARHLTTHAGHRPYLCKLCPRSFLLSHHLTRHMRTHSVEKRHVCEDCGKAFKRKESLEVHQLTHTKRTGLGLTCDVCKESCRNRADYVTHIKQHIEAGEKMGPDGLQPDNKSKMELDSEEDEEDEQYSDGDDDYEPPAYIAKKLPKPKKQSEESEEDPERSEKEESQKEQVVYVRHKDGNMIKKTIKTLMPVHRREVQDSKLKQNSGSNQPQSSTKTSPSKQTEEPSKSQRVDETEAQVQKIVASVFKEHKIALKHQPEQGKESSVAANQSRPNQGQSSQNQLSMKDERPETAIGTTSTPKSVKVIKRIVVRKPGGSTETVTSTKEDDTASGISQTTTSGHKVRRVIVRRIIRQGDTTREVIMNPDGTLIDPAELAKLPAGNVVRRVVVKKPLDKQSLVQAALQSAAIEVKQSSAVAKSESVLSETPKFELKTSQSTLIGTPSIAKTTAATSTPKSATVQVTVGDQETKEKLEQLEKRVEQQRLKIEELEARKPHEFEPMEEMSPERRDESDDEQQLPLKRVFVKKKQSKFDEEQEYNDNDVSMSSTATMLVASTPIPLTTVVPTKEVENIQAEPQKENTVVDVKEEESSPPKENTATAVAVKPKPVTVKAAMAVTTAIPITTAIKSLSAVPTTSTVATISAVALPRKEGRPTITSSKVYANKKIIVVKPEEASEVEEMSRELCSILDSTDSVVKMQETVLSNLTQISTLSDTPRECEDKPKAGPSNEIAENSHAVIEEQISVPEEQISEETVPEEQISEETVSEEQISEETVPEEQELSLKLEEDVKIEVSDTQETDDKIDVEPIKQEVQVIEQPEESVNMSLDEQDLSGSTDIFEPSDNVLTVQKSQLEGSVIELAHENSTINLNDTNDSQDSLEDKLQQMEG